MLHLQQVCMVTTLSPGHLIDMMALLAGTMLLHSASWSCSQLACVCVQTALKTLMVMHRLMRESNISFVEEVHDQALMCVIIT